MRRLILGLIAPLLFGVILVGCGPVEEKQQAPSPGVEQPEAP